MADDRQDTPEKQLLRLIEGAKAGESGGAGGRASKGAPKRPGLSLGAFAGRVSYFLRTLTARKPGTMTLKSAPRLTLARVNQGLMLAALALFVYVAGEALASSMQLSKPVHLAAKAESPAQASGAPAVGLNDSAYYLQKITARDIFREAGKALEKAAKDEAPLSAEENAATSGLSLVGISWSANPDCIIEDKERKRTYFVKRGQALAEGVKVEAIFKDRVVLSHEGREFELR